MDGFLTFLMIALVIAFMVNKVRYDGKQARLRQQRVNDVVDQAAGATPGYTITHRMDNPNLVLTLDAGSGQVGFYQVRDASWKVYPGSAVVSAEVFEDGRSVLVSQRGRQVGGAILGGIVAGTTGALIGGIGTAPGSKEYVERVELRIVIDDPDHPLWDIVFLSTRATRGGGQHQLSDGAARAWHGRIAALIRSTENKASAQPGQHVSAAPVSVADELSKLALLRNSGILTETEFEAEKNRLLSS
jgi:hypothetical protein